MKRKLVMTIVLAILSMALAACGSNNADLSTESESVQESPVQENGSEEGIQNSESNEEDIMEPEATDAETEVEDTEINEQKGAGPIWYMDSEGIKNDELGVVIRKDNDALDDVLFLFKEVEHNIDYIDNIYYSVIPECTYYDGDLDSYISGSSYQKGTIGNIDYAYDTDDNTLVFAGNGIIVTIDINDEDVENGKIDISDYLDKVDLIKPYDESNVDCLAYIMADGMYCPALGIKFLHDVDEFGLGFVGSGICCWATGPSNRIRIDIRDNKVYTKNANAQNILDEFVDDLISGEKYTDVIEETAAINIGKCKYLGRGVYAKYESSWLFYSEETIWSISILEQAQHADDVVSHQYEDYYLAIIEDLE